MQGLAVLLLVVVLATTPLALASDHGPIATIHVSPASATMATGQTKQFQAVAHDANGTPVPATFAWAVNGGGTVNQTGVFTAQTPGMWTLSASASGVSGTASLTVVQSGQLARIDVTPSPAVITADQTLQYTARGYDVAGNGVPINPVWTCTKGNVTGSGLYFPDPVPNGQPSYAAQVYAEEGTIKGSAVVTVNPGAIASLSISPATASITADGSQKLAATAKDSSGSVINNPNLIWKQPLSGRLDIVPSEPNSRLYLPDRTGIYDIVVENQNGPLSARSSVTVTPGTLANAFIAPTSATLNVNESLTFVVTAADAKGNPIADPALTKVWTMTGGIGTIDMNGKFTATRAGAGKLQAEVSDGTVKRSVSADVQVRTKIVRVEVAPAQATIAADKEIQFSAAAYESGSQPVPAVFGWSTNGGSIDRTGLFIPGPSGQWSVTATTDGVSGSAEVTVVPGPLAAILVAPPSASLTADQDLVFSASPVDAKGNPTADVLAWSVSSPDAGAVDQAGRYTPLKVGRWEVRASTAEVEGRASVEVTPGRIASLAIDPSTVALDPGQEVRFTLAARDAKGNAVQPSEVKWELRGEAVGSIDPSGRLVSTRPGAATVRATASFGGASTVAEASVVVRGGLVDPFTSGPGLAIIFGVGGAVIAAAAASVVLIRRRRRLVPRPPQN